MMLRTLPLNQKNPRVSNTDCLARVICKPSCSFALAYIKLSSDLKIKGTLDWRLETIGANPAVDRGEGRLRRIHRGSR